MNTELMAIKNELTMMQQQKEIAELRFELQKVQAEKVSRLDDSLFSPGLYQHYQKVAETLSRSGVIPTNYRGKPEDIFVAMAMGYQLGFPVEQSLQDIAVINGRPCLWGDGLLALALNHPHCESITEEPIMRNGIVFGYQCVVVRKGHDAHEQVFTMDDANRAGLLAKPGPWKQYPTRMLQMRARSLAIRDKFADALRGLRIAEIERDDSDVIEMEIVKHGDNATQTEKLKNTLKLRSGNNGAINESAIADAEISDIPASSEAAAVNHEGKMDDVRRKESKVHNAGKDDEPVSDEQLAIINALYDKHGFTQERKDKALAYFKVDKLEYLSDAQARIMILQLEK